jgi:Galactose oxidase, central domain/Kelch motif
MLTPRVGFDVALLGDGTVLAVGDDYACIPGGADEGSERTDIYDSTTDTWTETQGLNRPRKSFATVALRDGTALVAGGVNAAEVPYSSTWVFDPSTRGWRTGGLLGEARATPLMTALSDGRALILGGRGVGRAPDDLRTSEVYDPATSSWTPAGSLPARVSATHLVGLDDGGALALGYDSTDTEPIRIAYVFDPSGGEWTRVDVPRHLYGFGLVSLPGGALIFGGTNGGELEGGDGSVVDWVDRFDAASGRWSSQAPMSTPRIGSQAASLPDGRVLVAGGASRDDSLSGDLVTSAEVFDPSTGRWAAAGELLEPRQVGVATALEDGSVLVLGGNASFNTQVDTPFCAPPLTSVERFYPGS